MFTKVISRTLNILNLLYILHSTTFSIFTSAPATISLSKLTSRMNLVIAKTVTVTRILYFSLFSILALRCHSYKKQN